MIVFIYSNATHWFIYYWQYATYSQINALPRYAIWVDCIFFVLGADVQFMVIFEPNRLILFATKVHTYHCYLFVKQISITDLSITVYKYSIYAISTNYCLALTMRHILQHSEFQLARVKMCDSLTCRDTPFNKF